MTGEKIVNLSLGEELPVRVAYKPTAKGLMNWEITLRGDDEDALRKRGNALHEQLKKDHPDNVFNQE